MQQKEIFRDILVEKDGRKGLLLALLGVVVWFCLLSTVQVNAAQTNAKDRSCRSLFQREQFAQAAACYDRLYAGVETQSQSEEIRIFLKDRYLLHAAISWVRESRKQGRLEAKSYYLEHAIERLRVSIEKGYCKVSNHCLRHHRWKEAWYQEIQYARLTVVTGQEQANIRVQGFRYDAQEQGKFSRMLRPGLYVLQLKIPGQPHRQEAIVLKKSHHTVINVTPAQIQVIEKQIILAQKIPPLVIAGYIGGGAVTVAGVVFLVYGVIHQSNLNAIRRDPDAHRQQSESDYLQGMEIGRVLAISGVVATTAGIFLLVGSGIAHSMSRSSRKEVPRIEGSIHLGSFGGRSADPGPQ